MNKKKILVLIVAVIVVIVGFTITTEMNKINAKQIKAKETLQIATQEKNDVPKKNDKIFNFDIITPNSKYINVRNEISNIVLDSVLKDYQDKNNPRTINQVKNLILEIPDSLLANWTHDGEYSIVKQASTDAQNSIFLHLFNNDKTIFTYFTFNSKDGQVASQKDNIKTISSISLMNLKQSLAEVICNDIIKKYPNLTLNQSKKIGLKTINSFSTVDLYTWIDNTSKLSSNPTITTEEAKKNSLTIPVTVNGDNFNITLSYNAIQYAQSNFTPGFFNNIS